jgi:hypothetical protein
MPRNAHRERGLERSVARLDITGGTKTMVAAAYLTAAELGITTTYVDSSDYDPDARLPVPCTSELRRLQDPVGAFRLREIDDARSVAAKLHFDRAAHSLRSVASGLRMLGGATPVDPERIEGAAALCESLDHWQNARLASLTALPTLPPATASLAAAWNRRRKGENRVNQFAKEAPELLVAFAVDRLAWARLLDESNRMTAFLRAYSAVEVLLDGLIRSQVRRWFPGEKLKDWRDLDEHMKERGQDLHVFLQGKLGDAYAVLRGKDVVQHRNALIHKIEEPDEDLCKVYFEERRVEGLIEAVSRELGVREIPTVADQVQAIGRYRSEIETALAP